MKTNIRRIRVYWDAVFCGVWTNEELQDVLGVKYQTIERYCHKANGTGKLSMRVGAEQRDTYINKQKKKKLIAMIKYDAKWGERVQQKIAGDSIMIESQGDSKQVKEEQKKEQPKKKKAIRPWVKVIVYEKPRKSECPCWANDVRRDYYYG